MLSADCPAAAYRPVSSAFRRANQLLLTVYILREALKHVRRCRHEDRARAAWTQLFDHAPDVGIETLQRFAERLAPYLYGILARWRHPLNNNVVESINNSIQVIERRAYGYRDRKCFFVIIRAAFPGVGR
jgi:transposase